jgi:hypothetical protein
MLFALTSPSVPRLESLFGRWVASCRARATWAHGACSDRAVLNAVAWKDQLADQVALYKKLILSSYVDHWSIK